MGKSGSNFLWMADDNPAGAPLAMLKRSDFIDLFCVALGVNYDQQESLLAVNCAEQRVRRQH